MGGMDLRATRAPHVHAKLRYVRFLRFVKLARKRSSPTAVFAAVALFILASSLLISLSYSSSSYSVRDATFARLLTVTPLRQTSIQHVASSSSNTKENPDNASTKPSLSVAVVLDGLDTTLNYTMGTIRSLLHYSPEPISLYIVAPVGHHTSLQHLKISYPASNFHLYDVSLCRKHVSQVWFIAQRASLAELCSLFLADILPSSLETVMYTDMRATSVVSDPSSCTTSFATASSDALISVAVDLSDTCSLHPHFCYPLAYTWKIPKGLVCGSTPSHAATLKGGADQRGCRNSGEQEPLVMHPGVIVMHLSRMRKRQFTKRLVQASLLAWRNMQYRLANRGASDLLNNFLRLFPETLADLPCGCNYQFTARRRDARCPSRMVHIVTGDPKTISKRSNHDPYAIHFNYWRKQEPVLNPRPPKVGLYSRADKNWEQPQDFHGPNGESIDFIVSNRRHAADCPQQPYECSRDDRTTAENLNIDMLRETVYVLTRTSARPFFFSQTAASVSEQTHPYVKHLVGTDDQKSASTYLRTVKNVVHFPSMRHLFRREEVCEKCSKFSEGPNCARAPPLARKKERQRFFDCYCTTSYPMNAYMNQLQARVDTGWIIFVDDDNMMASRFSISELVAAADSKHSFLAFRSHLGRATPTDTNFLKRQVVMGDFDSSNFAIHSSYLKLASWGDKRCGDFRLASHLVSTLPVQWIDRVFIHANPLRAALGGLGGRSDVDAAPITVVLTSYLPDGWRPAWTRKIILTYTKAEMNHLVARVVLVWNNVHHDVSKELMRDEEISRLRKSGKFVLVQTGHNSLNNRWIATLPHIKTEIVLNLDDDVYVQKEGLICLLSWLRREPTRIVGPFVRRIGQGGKYVLDELLDSSKYSVALPRVLLLPTKLLRAYAEERYLLMHSYVDSQEAHCDDILLNIIAQSEFQKPPLRVLLPEASIVDLYDKCWPISKKLTGGLGLQRGRSIKRTECVRELLNMHNIKNLRSIAHIATCLPQGNALQKVNYIPRQSFKSMKATGVACSGNKEAEEI